MSRGRPSKSIPHVTWNLSLPAPLASEIELLLYDPRLEWVKVGSRSALCIALLNRWVAEQRHIPTQTSFPSEGEAV